MKQVVERTADTAAAADVTESRLHALVAQGKVRETETLIQQIEQRARRAGRQAGFAEGIAGVAADIMLLGEFAAARRLAEKSESLVSREAIPWIVVPVYYVTGRTAPAKALHADIQTVFARDQTFRDLWSPVYDAAAAIHRGDHAGAAALLGSPEATYARARPGLSLMRGMALYNGGDYRAAAEALQRAIDNRMVAEPTPVAAVATIWLARTRVKMGDTPAARRAYQDALAAWKDADPDLALLTEAKREYEALR